MVLEGHYDRLYFLSRYSSFSIFVYFLHVSCRLNIREILKEEREVPVFGPVCSKSCFGGTGKVVLDFIDKRMEPGKKGSLQRGD